MELFPIQILFFLYGISVLVFHIYCRIAYLSDRFWAENVDDVLFYQFIIGENYCDLANCKQNFLCLFIFCWIFYKSS